MRDVIIAANWKMHTSPADAGELARTIAARTRHDGVTRVICPPYVSLAAVRDALAESDPDVGVGAQNVHHELQGAYTGEVSAPMLAGLATWVIVGHSERRRDAGETDELIGRKLTRAFDAGLRPILCVGEQLADREAARTREVVARQLDVVLELSGAGALEQAVVAYEPVWAIGTGRTASPEQAQEVHAFIRARIGARDARIAGATRILYGGSVKAGNAAELFAMPDVDGGLIGGASLKADEFLTILAAAGPG